jgi:hypothetical protein
MEQDLLKAICTGVTAYTTHLTVDDSYAVLISKENPWLPPIVLSAMQRNDVPTVEISVGGSNLAYYVDADVVIRVLEQFDKDA